VDFSLHQEIPASVDRVGAALVDAAFLVRMAELPKLGSAEVVSRSEQGAVVSIQVRYLFQADLPGAVTRFVDPDKLSWVEDSTADLASHRTQCVLVPDNYANLLSGSYHAVLEADGSGCVRTVTGELKVHVPLVGGKAEKAIVSGLEENAEAQTHLLTDWLSSH
jgi:hypothetical protein